MLPARPARRRRTGRQPHGAARRSRWRSPAARTAAWHARTRCGPAWPGYGRGPVRRRPIVLGLVTARVDGEEHFALLHFLAFDVVDLVDVTGHARTQFNALHRFDAATELVPLADLLDQYRRGADLRRRRCTGFFGMAAAAGCKHGAARIDTPAIAMRCPKRCGVVLGKSWHASVRRGTAIWERVAKSAANTATSTMVEVKRCLRCRAKAEELPGAAGHAAIRHRCCRSGRWRGCRGTHQAGRPHDDRPAASWATRCRHWPRWPGYTPGCRLPASARARQRLRFLVHHLRVHAQCGGGDRGLAVARPGLGVGRAADHHVAARMHVVLQQRQQVAHGVHVRHQVGLHRAQQLIAVAVDHPARR